MSGSGGRPMADVAVIAIDANLGAARLLAQDLRAAGIDAEAMTPEAGAAALGQAAALLFFATPAALAAPGWRGFAAMSAANRVTAVLAVAVDGPDLEDLARVLPTDRVAPPDARAVIALLGRTLATDESEEEPEATPGGAFEEAAAPREAAREEEAQEARRSQSEVERDERATAAAPPPPPAPKKAAPGVLFGGGRRRDAAPAPSDGLEATPAGATPAPAPAPESPAAGDAAAIRQAKLYENAPRKMRVGARREVVVRISADQGAEAGMEGLVRAHAVIAAQVMTVALDDPDFAFAIRPLSPATQWIDRAAVARLGFLGAAATAEWRWSIEALRPGANRLAITASARVADANGAFADAGLPPQIVQVRVSVAPGRILGRVARWSAVAIGAAVVGHYGVAIVEAVKGLFG